MEERKGLLDRRLNHFFGPSRGDNQRPRPETGSESEVNQAGEQLEEENVISNPEVHEEISIVDEIVVSYEERKGLLDRRLNHFFGPSRGDNQRPRPETVSESEVNQAGEQLEEENVISNPEVHEEISIVDEIVVADEEIFLPILRRYFINYYNILRLKK
jgi:predicted nuclease of restriction endonuclease-like (RecB) superfamily